MKNFILCFGIFLCAFSFATQAQIIYGDRGDSTFIKFTSGSIANFIPDTATTPLWQIGQNHKPFFNTDSTAIITDTAYAYPINANNWFVLKIPDYYNRVISFWHKYQTDSGHDGGTVEFSLDYGATWQNVKEGCNVDGTSLIGVHTENFYSATDTLISGTAAFSGVQNSWRYSGVQFFTGLGGSTCLSYIDTAYLRFRFISDPVIDTLAGWLIDSIKIENYYYPDHVSKINTKQLLNVFPNPSYDGSFTFPALTNEQQFSIEVYNSMGARILKMPYGHSIDLSSYAKGLYFYKVSDGTEYYSGRLLTE